MIVRPFQFDDLDPLIDLASISFAEENISQGVTVESFKNQIRMITRGRMVPFKAMSALAGIKWAIFVAEVDGDVVGCGSCMGRAGHMELGNLMVQPSYRRRGIGKAILQKRLEYLRLQDVEYATTSVLATNEASLNNVTQQGFEVFDRYSIWEKPINPAASVADSSVLYRPVTKSDQTIFQEFERQLLGVELLKIIGSSFQNYHTSYLDSLMLRFGSTQKWSNAFVVDKTIGFLLATTSTNQTIGRIARPIFDLETLDYLPQIFLPIEQWLGSLGKTAIQISIPNNYPINLSTLPQGGWNEIQSWIRLSRRL